MSTIQLDFAAKERFGLSYMDETGNENGEVFVIHRARYPLMRDCGLPSGAVGWKSTYLAFPGASPGNHHLGEAQGVCKHVRETLKIAGVRVKVDDSDNTIGRRSGCTGRVALLTC